VAELRRREEVECGVVATGQHADLVDSVFQSFGLAPDVNLGVMRHGQSLSGLTAATLTKLEPILDEHKPDLVLVQGDTSTTFAGALAAFSARIAVAHVEAGLRTGDMQRPFPEEFNRRAVALMATYHFAPTDLARQNLLAEGVDPCRVFVTGNTVVDALQTIGVEGLGSSKPPYVMVTTHRRENWGEGQAAVCRAVRRISETFPAIGFLVFMHPNPVVRGGLLQALAGSDRIDMVEPASYPDFVRLMRHASLVMTDSGGVQEEAVALDVPLLVLRDKTERPEVLDSGTAWLVGTDEEQIVQRAREILCRPELLAKRTGPNPFGDGQASVRIADVLTAG
jgi:UDP-N-acetylglucosamine 2-epimerase (non-hydrolysing)